MKSLSKNKCLLPGPCGCKLLCFSPNPASSLMRNCTSPPFLTRRHELYPHDGADTLFRRLMTYRRAFMHSFLFPSFTAEIQTFEPAIIHYSTIRSRNFPLPPVGPFPLLQFGYIVFYFASLRIAALGLHSAATIICNMYIIEFPLHLSATPRR